MIRTLILQRFTKENYEIIASELSKGRLIIYPAETMYGIGCDYRIQQAVQALDCLKERRGGKGYILLASDWEQVEKIAVIPEYYVNFLKEFWPAPLTAILEAKESVPDWMLYQGSIAVRIPSNAYTRKIIDHYHSPIISTSINKSGEKALQDVNLSLSTLIDSPAWKEISLICKDEGLVSGKPSTVLDLRKNEPKVIREGFIPARVIFEKLEK